MRIRRVGSRNSGATLSELVVVVTLVGILTGMTLPRLSSWYDRMETRSAARETVTAFFVGRASAIAAGKPGSVVIDVPHATLGVITGGDTVLTLPVGIRHGVVVTATRQSMTYTAGGLGYGGANLRVVLSRGSAAETVLVSREGRVRIGTRGR